MKGRSDKSPSLDGLLDPSADDAAEKYGRFLLRREENFAPRPVQSIDTYISLDAECIVAGSSDKHLRFLETDTLEEIADCTVSKRSVNCVAVSEMSVDGDDPLIITGGMDNKIQIWDPASAQMERTIEVPTPEVRSLDIYQGSETYVLIGTRDAKVILWDMRKNQLKWLFEGHRASVHSVSITSAVSDLENESDIDYLCIASGGADRTVRTWSLQTGKKLKKIRHLRSISCMAVANKGIRPILATAGVERVIYLWDVESGIMLNSLRGHADQITSLSLWEGFQLLLISGSSDTTIRVYDVVGNECICVLQGHEDGVLSTTICDFDRPKIVSSSEDLSLIQWDLQAVIDEFFVAEGELQGARNSVPPYLPTVSYAAPEELDRDKLSKAERNLLRKKMKKEKQKKWFAQYLSAKGGETGRGRDLISPCSVDSTGYDSDEMERQLENLEGDFLGDANKEEATSAASPVPPGSGDCSGSGTGAGTVALGINRLAPAPAGASIRDASISLLKSVMSSIKIGSNKVGIDPIVSHPETTTAATAATAVAVAVAMTSSSNLSKSDHSKSTRRPSFGSESQKARILANQLESKYNIAIVEQQLAHERQKEQARAKLAMRLKKKKLQLSDSEARSDDSTAASAPGKEPHSFTAAMDAGAPPASTASAVDPAVEELEAVKREKLRQHKLQEIRRKNSMCVAKERSELALQRRLEEMAAKRKATSALPTANEEDEDNDDDEEDSV